MSVGRLVRAADFEKVLQARVLARSEHFAVHHAAGRPAARVDTSGDPELSTGSAPKGDVSVDDSPSATRGQWLGLVVPKRHARASVTRSLLKRQIRAAVAAQSAELPDGLFVVRLRAGFDRRHFISPASDALRAAARDELAAVLRNAARGVSA